MMKNFPLSLQGEGRKCLVNGAQRNELSICWVRGTGGNDYSESLHCLTSPSSALRAPSPCKEKGI